jgi:enoyl-CoA hydratase/carnithine racemase
VTGAPTLAIDGARATLTLSRPDEHNRIDPADVATIREHVAAAAAAPGVRALVITGSGERTFCSGYTLEAIVVHLHEGAFEAMLDALEACPLPTIAALNGSVYGGGCDLAMCCDWRVGVTGTRMFVPASHIGLAYYPGGLRRFTTRLGPAATKKIFLTSMPLPAEEMLRIGFLQDLVAPADFATTIDRYVQALAQADANAVASMKRSIDRLAGGDFDERAARRDFDATLRSAELRRRLAAGR